jgi:N-methylhydantoinase A
MVQAIMDITVNQGIDPRRAAFVAGGGAAGLNCTAIGRRLGCRQVIVPETGAALAAAGALISDLTAHCRAMLHVESAAFDARKVNEVLARLEAQCDAFAAGPGAGAQRVTIDWSTEARYTDQAWEIEVPLRRSRFESASDLAALIEDFHLTHEEIFAVSDRSAPIEAVSWNAEVSCRFGSPEPGRLAAKAGSAKLASRRVHFIGTDWLDVDVWRFEALPEGARIEGPAIIESDFTSIVIDPGATALRDQAGTLVIDISG